MATPKFGGEVIDINGRMSFAMDTDHATAGRRITYSKSEENRTAQAGRMVTITEDNGVALATDGDIIIGRLESCESDDMCTVTVGAQVLYIEAYGTVSAGAKLEGARSAGTSGDYGYAQAAGITNQGASYAQTAANNGMQDAGNQGSSRLIALEGRSGNTVSKIRCMLR